MAVMMLAPESAHNAYAVRAPKKHPPPRPADPFWSDQNQARLRASLKELEQGKVVIKTTEELEAMERE